MNHLEDLSPAPDAATSDPASPRPRRRAAIAIGAALVVGGVALAIWAVAAAGTPAPAAQPTSAAPTSAPAASTASVTSEGASTPASSASTPPSVSADAPVISAFSVEPTVAACPDDRASTVPLTFSWTSEGADRAWIGVGTSDASVQPAAEVDLRAIDYAGLTFACGDTDQVFTLTVQGAGGTVSDTIAITRELG